MYEFAYQKPGSVDEAVKVWLPIPRPKLLPAA